MSDPVLVLDYDVSMEDMRAAMKRAMRNRQWHGWWQNVFTLCLLGGAADSVVSGQLLQGGVFLALAALLTIPHWLLVRWIWNQPTPHVRIVIDDAGLHVHYPQHKTHNGFWWSRLTGVDETDGDFELTFDGESYPQMYVPACAFDNDEQRTMFRNLVEKHLPQAA